MRRAALVLALAACDDPLDQRLAIVRAPRVLAVIGEPAEARPDERVSYRAVLAGPDGPLDAAPSWAFCAAPKPPTEDNAVSAACVAGEQLAPLGTAAAVSARLPSNGCLQFGPETPPGDFRPRDADATGGYYQPVRAEAGDLLAFGLTRITCHLASAPGDVARAYDQTYVANANPTLDPIALAAVPADRDVLLTASWPASAVESYLYFDPAAQRLITRREAMRVSWFATGGALAVDASAVGEDDEVRTVATTWHTPAAGPVQLWLVLRDSRGGIAVQTARIDVRP